MPPQANRAQEWRPGFGGYGFQSHDGSDDWNDCRMNGFGVFGTLDMNRYVFGEAALDFYSAAPEHVEHGMDRASVTPSIAAGLRMFPDFVLTPYVQAGMGAEWTRVDLAGGRSEGLYPVLFAGIGTELNVTHELKLGANLRMLAASQAEPATHGESHAAPQESAPSEASADVPMLAETAEAAAVRVLARGGLRISDDR